MYHQGKINSLKFWHTSGKHPEQENLGLTIHHYVIFTNAYFVTHEVPFTLLQNDTNYFK